MTLTKRKAESLLKQNKITANVMTRWNRESNRNCKFLPGDRVTINSKKSSSTKDRTLHGARGEIVAVTTVDGMRMNSENRKTTHYYVLNSNTLNRFASYMLRKA